MRKMEMRRVRMTAKWFISEWSQIFRVNFAMIQMDIIIVLYGRYMFFDIIHWKYSGKHVGNLLTIHLWGKYEHFRLFNLVQARSTIYHMIKTPSYVKNHDLMFTRSFQKICCKTLGNNSKLYESNIRIFVAIFTKLMAPQLFQAFF